MYEEDLDSCKMNPLDVPSLQNIAILNIVASTWKARDLKDVIERHVKKKGHEFNGFDELHEKVIEKLPLVSLPTSMHAEIGNALICLGRDVLKFLSCASLSRLNSFLAKYFTLEQRVTLIGSIHFDALGLIDVSKMLTQLLVKECSEWTDEFIEDAYELACTYSQESLASVLLEKHRYKLRSKIRAKPANDFIRYWTLSLTSSRIFTDEERDDFGIANVDNASHSHMMDLSIDEGAFYSVVHFWSKIGNEERRQKLDFWIRRAEQRLILENITKDEISSETTCLFLFLFSQLTTHQKRETITSMFSKSRLFGWHGCHKFTYLFNSWHLRSFFLPIFQVVQSKMSEYQYRDFVFTIGSEINCSNAFILPTLAKIWRASSTEMKESFIEGEAWMSIFLLNANDTAIPCLILSDASNELKVKAIRRTLSDASSISRLLSCDKLQLLEQLMVETVGSEIYITELKELAAVSFTVFVDENCSKWSSSHVERSWAKALELLNWSFKNQSRIEAFKLEIETEYIINKVVLYAKYLNGYCDSKDADATKHLRNERHKVIVPDFVAERNFEYVGKFLDWYFDKFEGEKWKIVQYHAISNPSSLLKSLYDWKSFDSFVCYCFGSSVYEKENFKAVVGTKEVLCDIISNRGILKEILDYADKVLTWCFDSDGAQIEKFKDELLFSSYGPELIRRSIYSRKWSLQINHSEQLEKWFEPYSESAAE